MSFDMKKKKKGCVGLKKEIPDYSKMPMEELEKMTYSQLMKIPREQLTPEIAALTTRTLLEEALAGIKGTNDESYSSNDSSGSDYRDFLIKSDSWYKEHKDEL